MDQVNQADYNVDSGRAAALQAGTIISTADESPWQSVLGGGGRNSQHCTDPHLETVPAQRFSLQYNPLEVFKLAAKYVPQYRSMIRELVCLPTSLTGTAAAAAAAGGAEPGRPQAEQQEQQEQEEKPQEQQEQQEEKKPEDLNRLGCNKTRFVEVLHAAPIATDSEHHHKIEVPAAAAGAGNNNRTLVGAKLGFAGRRRGAGSSFKTRLLHARGHGLRELLDWQQQEELLLADDDHHHHRHAAGHDDDDDRHEAGHELLQTSDPSLRSESKLLKMADEEEKEKEKEKQEKQEKQEQEEEENKGRLDRSSRSIENMKVKQVGMHVDELRKRLERVEKMIANLKMLQYYSRTDHDVEEELREVCAQKDKEKRELQGLVNGLQELCMNHEKSIYGLHQALKMRLQDDGNNKLLLDHQPAGAMTKLELHRELYRLSGMEAALRSELEAARREITMLRCENQSLIARLRAGHEREAATAAAAAAADCSKSRPRVDQDHQLRAQLHRSQAQVTALQQQYDALASKLRLAMSRQSKSSTKEEEMHRESEAAASFTKQVMEENKTLRLELAELRNTQSLEICNVGKQLQLLELLQQQQQPGTLTLTTATKKASSDCGGEQLMLQEYALGLEEDLRQSQAHCSLLVQEQEELRLERYELLCSLAETYLRLSELEQELNSRVELVKALETDLDRSALQIQRNRDELSLVRSERDQLRKEGELMSREALHMSLEVELLRRRLRQLDDELLLKDGQISILRSCWEDS